MKTKVILSQQMASAIIAAGQEEAQKNNWSVSIAVADDGGHVSIAVADDGGCVADDGGHLLALSRMDDCAPIAAYISQEKARTAALGRRETKGYEEMVNNGRTAFVTAPLLTSLEGGVEGVTDVAGRWRTGCCGWANYWCRGRFWFNRSTGCAGRESGSMRRSRKRQQRCWRNKRKRGDKQ